MTIKYDVFPLFSSPIYKSYEELDNNLAEKIKQFDVYRNNEDNAYNTHNTYILEEDFLQDLKDRIQAQIQFYMHSVLNVETEVEFYITNSWVTVHEEGDFAPIHKHVNSLFSGTYYIETPEDDSSRLVFHSPDHRDLFPDAIFPIINEWNIFNSRSYYYEPKRGDLFLFPSSLNHSVTRSTSKNKRYCLAFNIFIKGVLEDRNMENPINTLVLK